MRRGGSPCGGSAWLRGRGREGQLSLPLPLPDAPELRELDEWEVAVADYASTGMTLGTHPVALLRDELDGVAPNEDLAVLPDERPVEVAGVVVARQRPGTAKGVVFMLLEDETGVANVMVPPKVYTECRLAVRTAAYVRVEGRLERRGKVINVRCEPDRALVDAGPAPGRGAHDRAGSGPRDGQGRRAGRAGARGGGRSARGGCACTAELRRQGLRCACPSRLRLSVQAILHRTSLRPGPSS